MYGAMLGDLLGSQYEFKRNNIEVGHISLSNDCHFTDDSVMTVAVAEALMDAGREANEEEIKAALIKSMKKWGKRYPNAGYGGRFREWLKQSDPKPYGSYGNGSAMRVSSVGWLYDTLERTLEVAKWTAEVSHNHIEGIKGAQCTAAVIFLGRKGKSKEEIKAYVEENFGYDTSKTLAELKEIHGNDVTCMDSLPKALRSFFVGNSYREIVYNAISLGGDTDTNAAIAGAMAEGFYRDVKWYVNGFYFRTPKDMLAVVGHFYSYLEDTLKIGDEIYKSK